MSARNTQPFKVRKDSKFKNLEVNNLFAKNTGTVETGNLNVTFLPLMSGLTGTVTPLSILVTRNANIVTVSGRISVSFTGILGSNQVEIDIPYPLPLKAGTALAGTAGTGGQFMGESNILDNAGISFRLQLFLTNTNTITEQFVVSYETY